jgi:tetratricopeptide (TPR) repeat protein
VLEGRDNKNGSEVQGGTVNLVRSGRRSARARRFDAELPGLWRLLLTLILGIALGGGPVPAAGADGDGDGDYREWSERLAAAAKQHDGAEELRCMTTIGARWRWAIMQLPTSLVLQVVRDAEAQGVGDARMELLGILFDVRWHTSDNREPSRWWLQYCLYLLEHSRAQEASAVAAHISYPYALIAVQVDKRYEPIRRSRAVENNIRRAAENHLARMQMLSTERPRNLGLVTEVAYALKSLGRYEDVVHLSDAALERIRAAGTATVAYDSLATELPWLLDAGADALMHLGRYEDAVVSYRRAVEAAKPGEVRLANNLAHALVNLNRPQEALAALPDNTAAGMAQRAYAAMIRVMAAVELGNDVLRDTALDELRGYRTAFPARLEWALVVSGRDDEATAILIAAIEDPALRSEALNRVQRYLGSSPTEQTRAWEARDEALLKRADVGKTIKQYGSILSFPIFSE